VYLKPSLFDLGSLWADFSDYASSLVVVGDLFELGYLAGIINLLMPSNIDSVRLSYSKLASVTVTKFYLFIITIEQQVVQSAITTITPDNRPESADRT
jgi:hypothetical protein